MDDRVIGFAKRVFRELKKNSLKDFIQKVFFYSLGKGKYLWALDKEDWSKKKEVTKKLFACYPIGSKDGGLPIVVYVLPGVWIAGGIAVALRHANILKKKGYRVYIVTQDLNTKFSWFADQDVEVIPINKIWNLLERGIDILIATGWNSVPTVDFLPARRKCYFVQLDERRFYQDRVTQEFVEETYRQPFEYITMAHWIVTWLKEEFGHSAAYVPNGLDLNIFRPVELLERKKYRKRVLIEGPINIPFKGVADAYEAVKDLDCDIWMVSSNGVPRKEWRVERFFEKVPLHDMPRLYSSCDILLKMSTIESFSYPPLEMMACGGVPVILEVSGIEEYAVDGKNCLVVHDGEEAKAAVQKLIEDKKLYHALVQGGLETAQNWHWEKSADAMEKIIVG